MIVCLFGFELISWMSEFLIVLFFFSLGSEFGVIFSFYIFPFLERM